MASPFIIGRVEGDHPVRGSDDTVTRIYYQSPPPRAAITNDNDEDGLSARRLIYEDRGVSGVLHSTTYPRSQALTILSRESLDKPVVRYEPRHTPPDSFEAQDYALRKAEILLQETQRAMKRSKRVKVAEPPRRDSAVNEEEEDVELQRGIAAAKPLREALATIEPEEQPAHATIPPQKAHATAAFPQAPTTAESQVVVTTTEPHTPRKDEVRQSPKRQKLTPSPTFRSPALPADTRPSKPRAGSETRFAKPKTPTATTMPAPPARTARGDSVASVRSSDSSRASRQSRGVIKDDLTIDSKFGLDADAADDHHPNEIECLHKNGKWYVVIGEGLPDWALESRPRTKVVASPRPRRGTGAWRNNY